MPAAERRRWTAAQVRQLIADSSEYGPRYELIAGELLVTPAPAPRHQVALLWMYDRIASYVREQRLGYTMLSPADLELAADEINQPDLFVIPELQPPARWADYKRLRLAVEVSSPSTARFDRSIKRPFYQRVGVPEYWIVDLDARLVERWRPSDERPEIITGQLVWRADGARSDLLVQLDDLWGALPAE